jgi:UDP-glucose 4-epimerase
LANIVQEFDYIVKNVLVLGACGFIGRHLVNRLLSETNVVGYDRVMSDYHAPCQFIQADFAHDEKFEEILSSFQIDTVYHLISSTIPCSGTERAVQEIEENIVPTVKLLEAMKNTGTKRIIFSSSGGTVYGESSGKPHLCTDPVMPICSYGIQKIVIEQYLRLYDHLYDMECLIARISNPYGILPLQNRSQGIIPIFLSKLLSKQPIILYGETTRDYIHISDAVEALINLGQYEKEKRIFNIGTGVSTSLHGLLQMMEIAAKCKFIKIIKQDIRDCDVYENTLDISDTVRELNWHPKILLEDGILLTLKEMREHND